MTKVLLLEGPDGNRYRGTLLPEGVWYVDTFANMRSSVWWKTQYNKYDEYIPYNFVKSWREYSLYTNEKLKEIFGILAESKTYIKPSNIIVHYTR